MASAPIYDLVHRTGLAGVSGPCGQVGDQGAFAGTPHAVRGARRYSRERLRGSLIDPATAGILTEERGSVLSERERAGTYLLARNEGPALWLRGNRFTLKASGTETAEGFAAVETILYRGAEAPAHRHHQTDEALYVLEGEMELIVDGERLMASSGGFAYLPRGTKHQYLVRGDGTARALWFVSPAGFERFWLEMGVPVESAAEAPAPAPPDAERMAELGLKYATEFFGPGE